MKQLLKTINLCWKKFNKNLAYNTAKRKYPNADYLQKILIIIAFVSIFASLIIINFTGPASGYEISIYQAYPIYLWFLFVLTMFCGISVLVYQAFQDRPSNLWVAGLIALIGINVLIMLLPFFREYLIMGRGDVLTHIGFAKDIISTGNFEASGIFGENLYPLLHINMAEVYYLTGINLNSQSEILPLFYYIFFILSLYLLGQEITKDHAKTILIMVFGSILITQFETSMLTPSVEGFYLLPFLMYLFYKTRTSTTRIFEYDLILIIFLIFIPFFHPGEVTFFLILILALIYISARLYQRISKTSLNTKLGLSFIKDNSTIFLLLMVIWFIWFTSFSSFLAKASMVINWFLNEIGTSNMQQYLSILSTANLSLNNFLTLAMSLYGQYILFFLLSSVISIIVLRRTIFSKDDTNLNISDVNIFTYAILFLVFAVFVLFSFASFVGVEFNRVLKYEMLIAIILNGSFLYSYLHNRQKIKKYAMILIISFLMISGVIGLINAYPSPFTKTPNYQTTDMELTGQNWFMNYRNPDLIIDNNLNFYYGQILRFNDANKGVEFNNLNKIIIYNGPDHFNYLNKSTYGETYDTNWYYIDMTLLKIAYPDLYPRYENKWRYTPADYNKFNNLDKSVNNIYSNGDYRVYYIIGHAIP